MQRNKLYAHNDKQRILSNENLTDRHPILYPDIQEMIDFALDCTGLILGVLTDVNREKAFEEEMQRQLGGNDNGELQ